MSHKITINNCDDAEVLSKHGLEKTMYEAGETVTFSVITMTDTRYEVASDQVRIYNADQQSSGRSMYSFTMPDTDVEIRISSYSSMMNPYQNNSGFFGSGFMTFGSVINPEGLEMGKQLLENLASALGSGNSTPDPSIRSERPAFCPECGYPTKESGRFCTECGAPLLKK